MPRICHGCGSRRSSNMKMMTTTTIRVCAAVVLWALCAPAEGQAKKASGKPQKARAEVRDRAGGGDGLWVDGALVWPPAGDAACEVTGPLVWSRRGDAVATLARRGGHTFLVVALLAPQRQALEWLIPAGAGPAQAIMWLGPTRVAVGPRDMEPKVVASWTVGD